MLIAILSKDSVPKDSTPKSQKPLQVVPSESLLDEGIEQTGSQTEEALNQLNTNHTDSYVTRNTGTLYHVSISHSVIHVVISGMLM